MIRVNDKFDVEWEPGMTVSRLLERLGFTAPLIVVSVNGELVRREEYSAYEIPDGARVEAIHMVAGG